MRILNKIAIVAVMALLVAVVAQPAQASCATPSLIGTTGPTGASFIWTSGVFSPGYYAGYPPLMYSADAVPPVTPNFNGVFWRQGTGDPSVGLGDDSGSYNWSAAGGFYYAAYPGAPGYYSYFSAGTIFSSWFPPGVDGCVGGNACMCLLMTDSDGMTGYFALTGAMSAATTDTFLNQTGATDGAGNDGPIILVPIPAPSITGSTRVDAGGGAFDVDVSVTVPPLAGNGVYVKDGCECGPTGFRVKSQVLARGTMPPADRSAGWVDANLSTGEPQPPAGTGLGGTVTVRANCGAADSDTYLATELVFDSGFGTTIVSSNSTRVECGPNLADPDDRPTRPRPRTDRPKPRRR